MNIEYIGSWKIGRIRILNIYVTRKLFISIRISNIWCKIFEYSNIFVIHCEVWLFEENESNVIIDMGKKKYLVLVFWHTSHELTQQHRKYTFFFIRKCEFGLRLGVS